MLRPNVRNALSSAPPEMFQTSSPSFLRTLPMIPGRQTTMSRISFLGTRPPSPGQPIVSGSCCSNASFAAPTLEYSGCCVPGICDLIASWNEE